MNSEFDTDGLRRRAELAGACEACRLPGHRPPLSDAAAVALAAGRVDLVTRQILAARRQSGKQIPSVGGFGALRILVDERDRWLSKDTMNKPGSALVYRVRAGELAKRIGHLRSAVVMSQHHYANGVRAVRRERRDGMHLDLEQRDSVFDALMRTPAPVQHGTLMRGGLAVVDAVTARLSEVAERTPLSSRIGRANDVIEQYVDQKDDRFADRYDTLLFAAGTSFDRVERSPAWRSEYFEVQRNQLDLADELTQISVDVQSLRQVSKELDAIANTVFDDVTRTQVRTRRTALDAVWTQLVDRVAALSRVAELVTQAEGRLETMNVMARAQSLDTRIDDLVARAGFRELSTDNTHHVGDQVNGVDEMLAIYGGR